MKDKALEILLKELIDKRVKIEIKLELKRLKKELSHIHKLCQVMILKLT